LYVLDDGGTIYKSSDGGVTWDTTYLHIPGAQKIFGADTELFAGDGYAVFVCDFSASPPTKTQITDVGTDPAPGGLLRGAAWDGTDYYICTANVWGDENTGIFTVTGTAATKKYSSSVKGIIAVGTTTIVAVNAERQVIYKYGAVDFDSPIGGPKFTGGMALWEHGGDTKILLGLQGGGSGTYRYGYRELDLDSSGDVTDRNVYIPGTTARVSGSTSIDPGSNETSAIGDHAVNALYVIPSPPGPNSGDSYGRPIIVASTQQNGMWSYRVRRGTPQWNGEDNVTR
jgi:hypothetical protein